MAAADGSTSSTTDPDSSTSAAKSTGAAASTAPNGTPVGVPKNWRVIEEEEFSTSWSTDIKMAAGSYAQALEGTYGFTNIKPLYNSNEDDSLYILQGVAPDSKTNKPVPGLFVFNSLNGDTMRFTAPAELADIVKNLDAKDGILNWDGLKMDVVQQIARAA